MIRNQSKIARRKRLFGTRLKLWLIVGLSVSGLLARASAARQDAASPQAETPNRRAAPQASSPDSIARPSAAPAEIAPAAAAEQERVVDTAKRFLEILDRHDPSFDEVKLPDSEAQIVVEVLRERYPIVSLTERLRPLNSTARIEKVRELYSEKPDSLRTGQAQEMDSDRRRLAEMRLTALETLHGSKAKQFIQASGFGIARMPQLGAESLPYREQGPLALRPQTGTEALYGQEPFIELIYQANASTAGSGSKGSAAAETAPTGATLSMQLDSRSPSATPTRAEKNVSASQRMPALETIESLNNQASRIFLNPQRIGLHRGLKWLDDNPDELKMKLPPQSAIGFLGHAVDHLYDENLGIRIWNAESQDSEIRPDSWKLNRLELVSLLLDDRFQVYVSENLPNMNELKGVQTRPLNTFEFMALGKLFQHEDLVIESTENRIRMLGALRASESCLECHGVKQGEMLGALSYELIRRQPAQEK